MAGPGAQLAAQQLEDDAPFLRVVVRVVRAGVADVAEAVRVGVDVDLEQAADPAALMHALERRRAHSSELVREHVEWALSRLGGHPDGF